MTAQKGSSAEISAELQYYVQHSIASFTTDLTKVLDDRFASLKRELAEDNLSSIQSVAKKIRLESHEFKSKGNQQQYEHQLKLIEHMDDAQRALEANKIAQAKAALQDGTKAAQSRCKLILLADKSEFGWSTVSEYLTDKLAENSEDEKRIQKAEKIAEKKANKRKKDKERRPSSQPPSVLRLPFRRDSRPLLLQRQIGPCFKMSILLEFLQIYLLFPKLAL